MQTDFTKSMLKYITFFSFIFVLFSCSDNKDLAAKKDSKTSMSSTVKQEVSTSQIQWMTLEQAVTAQKANPKKIMMDAYTDWCGPCKMLDRNTFSNADVIAYVNEHFYAVKFDAEGNEKVNFKGKTYTNPNYDPAKDKSRNAAHQLSYFFRITSYPTILFLDENADLITPVKGFKQPQQLELFLKLIAKDDYKKVKTQEEWTTYQSNFKPEFK